jgi:hypothetical protein
MSLPFQSSASGSSSHGSYLVYSVDTRCVTYLNLSLSPVVSRLCAPANRLWAPPHRYRRLFTKTAVALAAASRDLCYLIMILITRPTLRLSYRTFVRRRLWPVRFLRALSNPLAFQRYLLFQLLGSQEPDSLFGIRPTGTR